MNYKMRLFIVLLIISVFLLSGCEVYKTLYGTGAEKPEKTSEPTEVIRVEGAQAKDPINLAKNAYATATATEHDPFKVGANPLGPFAKGTSLGFTLGQWLAASGIGIYSVDGENAELELSFKNLVPSGLYTVWCSRLTFPPEPKIVDMPCGAEDGSENSFKADEKGTGSFSLKLNTLEASTNETASAIALAYHSDGKTHGSSPGSFGLDSHVQLFFLLPVPTTDATKFEVPIKFVNHIDANLPEQDVFIEKEMPAEEQVTEEIEGEKGTVPTGEVIKEKEVMVGEKSPEKPIVVVVQETDLVSLVPKAEDPDKDASLVFTFTSPLDEKGEWQTDYGDSGQYTVTVTVSDGQSTTARDVLVIVNRKEEQPTIDSTKPIESGLTLDETQAIEFSVAATDLNKDPLTYVWKVDGTEVGDEDEFAYQTTYDDAGTHTVKIDVSDELSSTSKIWSVEVRNVNRKPVLEHISDIKAKETDEIILTALATDDDKDLIAYSISDERFEQDDNVFAWQTDYDSSGTYQVTVSASDGQDVTTQTFNLNVENVNRPPTIVDIIQKT